MRHKASLTSRLWWFTICKYGSAREQLMYWFEHRQCECGVMCEKGETRCELCELAPILQFEHIERVRGK